MAVDVNAALAQDLGGDMVVPPWLTVSVAVSLLLAVVLVSTYGLSAFLTRCWRDDECRETVRKWRDALDRSGRYVGIAEAEAEAEDVQSLRNAAGVEVVRVASSSADDLGKGMGEVEKRAIASVDKFGKVWRESCLSFLSFLGRHWAIVSATLPALTLAIDVFYFGHFGFNVVPYWSGSYVTELAFAFIAAAGAVLVASLFSLVGPLLIRTLELFGIVTAGVRLMLGVLRVLFTASLLVLKHGIRLYFGCCRWRGFGGLSLHLLGNIQGFRRPAAAKARRGAPADEPRRVAGKDKVEYVHPIVWGGASASLAVILLTWIAFESHYRADAACGSHQVVVVHPPLQSIDDPVNIGSKGEYVFLVSGGGLCEGAVSGCTGRLDCLKEFDFREPLGHFAGSPFSKSKELQVVVVPLSHVYCMYETDKTPCGPVPSPTPPDVEPTPSVDGEHLLRKEIEEVINCEDGRVTISDPFIFGPHESTLAAEDETLKEKIKTWADDFVADLQKLKLLQNKVYLFGFASADGSVAANERISRERVSTVYADVSTAIVDGNDWPGGSRPEVEKKFRGEMHLTNGVANSRAVRMVACVQSEDARSGDD